MEILIIKTNVSSLEFGPDQIVRWTYQAGVVVGVKEAEAEMQALRDGMAQTGIQYRKAIIDISKVHAVTRDARDCFSGMGAEMNAIGVAIIVNSAIGRMIGNLFLDWNAPEHPVKLFNHISDAEAWLEALSANKIAA